MSRVFVYEYCVALGPEPGSPDPARPLFRMGQEMRDAVAADFRRVPGVEVLTLDSVGADIEKAAFRELASAADWSVVIAPELRGLLAERVRWVLEAEGRPLNPSAETIALTSDKLRLARWWRECGVPTPATLPFARWAELPFPMVAKPADGAGSLSTQVLHDRAGLERYADELAAPGEHRNKLIAQSYVPGRPASVAFLCGPAGMTALAPTAQHISADGRLRYEGCGVPIRPDLADRAVSLGRRAVVGMPGLLGFVGVDIVLGEAADGSNDFAIEVNPRVSMSYLALRELADFDLAGALLRSAEGTEPLEPRWKPCRVKLGPDWAAGPEPGGNFFD